MEVRSTANLVDWGTFDETRGITTTIPRSEVEEALAADSAELFIDVARGDEAYTVKVAWGRDELEELLAKAGGDNVTLAFDRTELEEALAADVEGHGLREKALIFTVAVATAAGAASAASAQLPADPGGGPSGAPITAVAGDRGDNFVTDVSSAGGYATSSERGDFVTDASSGGYTQAADQRVTDATGGYAAGSERGDFVTDASSGGYTQAADQRVTDASGGYAGGAQAADQRVTDASGGYAGGAQTEAAQPGSAAWNDQGHFGTSSGVVGDRDNAVTDVSSGGYGGTVAQTGDEGINVPSPATGAAIAGGLALLITGAGFVLAGQRNRQRPHPA